MKVSFRLAKSGGDLDLLLQLTQEYYAFEGHAYDRERIRPAIENLIDGPKKGAIWIIEFRGKGIGKRAIVFLEAECANLKVKALHLEVERKNRNAQKFYRNLGFLDNDRQLLTKKLNPE